MRDGESTAEGRREISKEPVGRRAASDQRPRVTQLLRKWSAGDLDAANQALIHVHDALHRIAARYFQRERRGHTLQATAVLDEAFVTLIQQQGIFWRDRAHFIGVMARLMRRVLIEHARSRNCAKRGGRMRKVTLSEATAMSLKTPSELVALDDALKSLGEFDPRKAALVELRFFGGLSLEEAARAVGVSRATAVREWRRARAWLYRELKAGAGS